MRRFGVTIIHSARFIDRWHWVFLVLAAPLLLFPSPSRSLVLLVIPGLWIASWVARGRPMDGTPLNGSVLLMGVMVLVSLYATYDINISFAKIAGMVLGFGVFFGFVREGKEPRVWWRCFWIYVITVLGMALLALPGAAWSNKIPLLARVISLFPTRLLDLGVEGGFSVNQLAGALVWVLPSLIALATWTILCRRELGAVLGRLRAWMLVAVVGVMTAFVLFVLVLTQSRGGYLGFGVGMAALLILVVKQRARLVFTGVVLLILAAIGLMSFAQIGTPSGLLVSDGSALDPASAINTWEGRVEVWSRGIYGMQDFPFTGMGMNTFRHIAPILYPFFLIGPDVDISHAHNEFLQAGLDLGIPGLVAFVALYIGAFWMLDETWRSAGSRGRVGDGEIADPGELTRDARYEKALFGLPAHPPPAPSRIGGRGIRGGTPPPPPIARGEEGELGGKPPAPPFGGGSGEEMLVKALVLGFGIGLFAHIVYGMTDVVALGSKPGVLFWMLSGLVYGLYSQARSGRLSELAQVEFGLGRVGGFPNWRRNRIGKRD